MKMKILLIAVALLVVIEAHPKPTYPGFQNGRGNNPGRGPPWAYPQWTENQNNGFGANVEWICENPKTHDMMIITSEETRHTPQQNPGKGPWWQWHGNVPPGHRREYHQHGHWMQPTIIEEIPNTNQNRIPTPFPTTSEMPNNNNNHKQTESPPYHGGEGSIDIRIGTK